MKVYFRKVQGGVLVPDNEETAAWLQKKKPGTVLAGEFSQPRNYQFLKKMMALFGCCFDYFKDNQDWAVEYKGQKVEPSFDLFRKQLTILAGHYEATYSINGEIRLEAKSLSFANASEEEVERIYSDVINAAIKHVFKLTIDEALLRKMVDDILAFA